MESTILASYFFADWCAVRLLWSARVRVPGCVPVSRGVRPCPGAVCVRVISGMCARVPELCECPCRPGHVRPCPGAVCARVPELCARVSRSCVSVSSRVPGMCARVLELCASVSRSCVCPCRPGYVRPCPGAVCVRVVPGMCARVLELCASVSRSCVCLCRPGYVRPCPGGVRPYRPGRGRGCTASSTWWLTAEGWEVGQI